MRSDVEMASKGRGANNRYRNDREDEYMGRMPMLTARSCGDWGLVTQAVSVARP